MDTSRAASVASASSESDGPDVVSPVNGATVLSASDNATLAAMERKYYRLVWYSRRLGYNRDRRGPTDTATLDSLRRIEAAFPVETEALHGSRGDWASAFNHGVLATLRLVVGVNQVLDYGEEVGLGVITLDDLLREFPNLDT
jgi:hypothetical protein